MLRFLLVLARHLDLIGDHVVAYAQLIRAECAVSLRSWAWRLTALLVAALFILIGLVGAAVVLALGSNGFDVASWRAWAVPIACLVVAIGCWIFGLTHKPAPMSDILTQQLQRDLDLLRAANSRKSTQESEE